MVPSLCMASAAPCRGILASGVLLNVQRHLSPCPRISPSSYNGSIWICESICDLGRQFTSRKTVWIWYVLPPPLHSLIFPPICLSPPCSALPCSSHKTSTGYSAVEATLVLSQVWIALLTPLTSQVCCERT